MQLAVAWPALDDRRSRLGGPGGRDRDLDDPLRQGAAPRPAAGPRALAFDRTRGQGRSSTKPSGRQNNDDPSRFRTFQGRACGRWRGVAVGSRTGRRGRLRQGPADRQGEQHHRAAHDRGRRGVRGFDPGGLHRAVPEGERDHGRAREPERAWQAARDGRGGCGHLGPARARQPGTGAGQGAEPGRAARLGRDRARAGLRRGQGPVRLRLPVLLDDHGLARGRQGAGQLAGVLGHQELPGQARAARLSDLHPADGAAG